MFKKIITSLLFAAGGTFCSAGIIDHGDCTSHPAAGSKFEDKLVAKYFPELTVFYPKGLSRRDAWMSDIKKAAADIDYKFAEDDLKKLTDFVLSPVTSSEVSAPHSRLLEFELYARGRRELYYRNDTEMPQSWKTLLELPLEQRRYTTIPVIRAFYSYRGKVSEAAEALSAMIVSKKAGCFDTQGCIPDILKSISRNPADYSDSDFTAACKLLVLKYYINHPQLMALDKQLYPLIKDAVIKFDNDKNVFYSDIAWTIYTADEESLREMCKSDPFMRDFIVYHGLINRRMKDAQKIAMEFYRQSVICYPVAALKLPHDEAVKLLESYPEYSAVRDTLIIRKLEGREKIRAIDQYIAKYPETASGEDEKNGMILHSHAELHAMAGAELFKLGKPYEAAERWLKGCTAEDMAMVAEQVMSIEELKKFCDKHFPYPVGDEQDIFSVTCSRVSYSWYLDVLTENQLNFMLRNILARRLMREERFEEAYKYFTGKETQDLAHKFINLERAAKYGSRVEKLEVLLNMALLVRFDGNRLFGTFLEPDNLICRNQFPCTWGTKQSAVKLNKPDLPRFSYRYRAAELYAKASELTDDRNFKGMILWTAGSILKHRDPKAADIYFKKLYKVAPELTENNWFLPLRKVSDSVRIFYMYGK